MLTEDSPGREFRRPVQFSPLSTDDIGIYGCSATIRPTVANSRVTNGFGIGNNSLTVVGKFSNNRESFSIIRKVSFFSFSTHFGCLCRSCWCPSSNP
jgi:hypothetical protein